MAPSQATSGLEGGLRDRLVRYLVTRCDPPQVVACGASGSDASHLADVQEGRRLIVMNLDVLQLLDACWELTDSLLSNNTLGTLDMLKSEVLNLFQQHTAPPPTIAGGVGQASKASPAMEVSLRLTHMPPTSLGGLGGSSSLKQCSGCLVSLTGTMVRVTGKRVVSASSVYRCGKCGNNNDCDFTSVL